MTLPEAPALRVLHWNVHSWADTDGSPNPPAVADLISANSPDVISLVEVDEQWGTPRSLRQVADACGYTWLFAPAFEFGSDQVAGGFGNALLTRLPVLAVQQWQLLWPTRVYDGSEPSEQRSVLLARLSLGGTRFWAGTTHLPREDDHTRTTALHKLVMLTRSLGEPWLICGDFNTAASQWTAGLVTSPELLTYPAQEPAEAIDYCVCSDDFRPDSRLLESAGSDHLAQLITARLVSALRLPHVCQRVRRGPAQPEPRFERRRCYYET